MGIFLDWATFLTLFVLAFQYSWNHFLKPWYEKRLEKKGLDKAERATKTNKLTRRLQIFVMFLLILAIILALVDLTWR